MAEPVYDDHAAFYEAFITKHLARESSHFRLAIEAILTALADVEGRRVLDLACGEGHLSRRLAEGGADVTGVDLSGALIERAAGKSTQAGLRYAVGDAADLQGLDDASFDAVVCNMALMDMADLEAVFRSVARVLVGGGQFVFNVLHPCFETPFSVPERIVELDERGGFLACRVWRYADEGHWNSGGDGMRGTVGAHHRTLATYLNALCAAGFSLETVAEPMLPAGTYDAPEDQRLSQVPVSLVVSARRAP